MPRRTSSLNWPQRISSDSFGSLRKNKKKRLKREKKTRMVLEMRKSYDMWKDTHCLLRTLSKSCWSFLDSPDIRQVFTGFILHTDGETYNLTEPSDGFVDAFMDLLLYINTCPSGTPINVECNKNLPSYVLTGDNQGCKVFTDLPKELPFDHGK